MKFITKDHYKNFKRCPRLFALGWFNPASLKSEVSPAQAFTMEQGKEVGILAHQLFKGQDGVDFEKDIKTGILRSRLDILNTKKHELIEIKSTSDIHKKSTAKKKKSAPKIREKFLLDVAFQKYVCDEAKERIDTVKIGYINKRYTRKDELDVRKLFKIVDVTDEVQKKLPQIKADLLVMEKIIEGHEIPEIEIDAHCFDCKDYDGECPFQQDCLGEHLKDTIFNLYYDREGKRFKYFNNGIYSLKDIPDSEKLTGFRKKQKEAEERNEPVIDLKAIKEYVRKIKYPVYYLDFETFSTEIPPYPGTHPNQKIPFQASIHVEEKEGDELKHYSFLHTEDSDPRLKIAEFLVHTLNNKGTIMAYHASFENKRIEELAAAVPHLKQELLAFTGRFWDLETIFKKGHYVHPDCKGSTSIKSVLPVLCPERSYKDLAIGKGDLAFVQYLKMIAPTTAKSEKDKIKHDLEVYCAQDTYAMYAILRKIVGLFSP